MLLAELVKAARASEQPVGHHVEVVLDIALSVAIDESLFEQRFGLAVEIGLPQHFLSAAHVLKAFRVNGFPFTLWKLRAAEQAAGDF